LTFIVLTDQLAAIISSALYGREIGENTSSFCKESDIMVFIDRLTQENKKIICFREALAR
jgi:hypothetical protein